MSNRNNKDDFTPFDEDFNDGGFQSDNLEDFENTNTQGVSSLGSIKKSNIPGQRVIVVVVVGLILSIMAAAAYYVKNLKGSAKATEDEAVKVSFNAPPAKTFGEQFQEEYNPYAPVAEDANQKNNVALEAVEKPEEKEDLSGVKPADPKPQETEEIKPPPAQLEYQQPPQPSYQAQLPPQQYIEPMQEPVVTEEEKRINRMLDTGIKFANTDRGSNEPSSKKDGKFGSLLQATALTGTKANRLKNTDMTLTRGNMIDCVMNTKFNSTVLGMVSCTVTRNIYGASGRVVLIDRGSRVTGEYKGGLKQGSNRVFISWNRIETPSGVMINIDSPATSSLGEAGVTGNVDTKFWARFGGAMLISLIDDLGKAMSEAAAEKVIGGDVSLQNSSKTAEEMSKATLEKMIDIPPVLTKHQGDRISIYVARDLYFGDVYELTLSQ